LELYEKLTSNHKLVDKLPLPDVTEEYMDTDVTEEYMDTDVT